MRALFRSVLFAGLPVSVFGMLCFAAILTAADLPGSCYHAAAALPLLCGCLLSGFRAGKAIRRNGLRCGLCAAFLLTAIWYAAACILCRRLLLPVLLLLTMPCGMLGGVFGVNTKLPLPKRRLHGAERLSCRILLSCKTAEGKRRAKRNQGKTDAGKLENC